VRKTREEERNRSQMRNRHHHQYYTLKEWHAGQREKRKRAKWVPYSLRWEGGGFVRVVPQVGSSPIFLHST